MNDYITLKSTNDASPLKLAIMFQDWLPGYVQAKTVDRALTGELGMTLGHTWKVVQGIAKIKAVPAVGYAAIGNVEKWMGSRLPGDRALTMVDHYGNSWSVAIVNDLNRNSISPVEDGSGNYFLVGMQIESRSPVVL